MKIVINATYGGFGLSAKALELLKDKTEKDVFPFYDDSFRTDPNLVEIVEKLGTEANDELSCLKIVEVPDDVEWEINEYDGLEFVEEVHRKWY